MNFRKIFTTAFAATVLAGSLAGTAMASDESTNGKIKIEPKKDDQTLSVVITGGNFGTQNYSFDQQVYTTEDDFVVTVRDPRGTNAGWTINISGTTFTSTTGNFGVENLKLAKVNSIVAKKGNGSDVKVTIPERTGMQMSSTATPILTADAGKGAGMFEINVDAELTVPALQVVGDYASVITVDAVAAPR